MRIILPLLLLSAIGCGSADPVAACERYVGAYNDCVEEFGGSDGVPSTFCVAYEGLSGSDAKDAADALDCGTETIETTDCSTDVASQLASVLMECNS